MGVDKIDESWQLLESYNGRFYTIDVAQVSIETSNRRGISWYSASFLAVNCCLGIGILELPWAYTAAGGILPASFVHYVVLALMIGGLTILAYLTLLTNAISYQEVLLKTVGSLGQKVCILLMVVEGVGVCVMFLVVMGDHLEKFIGSVVSEEFVHTWYGNQKTLVSAFTVIFILPMCLLREINCLKYVSVLGVFAILYVVVVVVVRFFVHTTDVSRVNSQSNEDVTWVDAFLIAPGVSVGYMCHFEMPTILASMKEKSARGFARATSATVFICTVCNSLIPVFGYLTFGTSVNKEIILSYAPTSDIYIAYFVLALKCLTGFPVIFFCIRNAFHDIWVAAWKLSSDDVISGQRKRLTSMGASGFVIILLVYVLIPDIVTAIAYTGGISFFFSCVFPGLGLIHSVVNGFNSKLRKWTNCMLICVGTVYVTSGIFLFGLITAQEIANRFT